MQLARDMKSMYYLNHVDVRKICMLEWSKSCRRYGFKKHVDIEDLIQGFYAQLLHRRTLETAFDYSVSNPSAQFATYMYTCICTYIKDYMQRDRRHSLGIKADTVLTGDGSVVLVADCLVGSSVASGGAGSSFEATAEYGQDFVWSGEHTADTFSLKDFCCEIKKDRTLPRGEGDGVSKMVEGLSEGRGLKDLSVSLGVPSAKVSMWKRYAKEAYRRYTGTRHK